MIEVSVDLSGIDALLGEGALEKAQRQLAEKARDAMEEFVPMRTGSLRTSAVVLDDEVEYGMEYASDVYHMDDAKTRWTEAGTHSEWADHMKESKIEELERHVAKALTGRGGA